MYEHDMSKEREMGVLLPEGWRELEIIDCREDVSKGGNEMFVFTVRDVETNQIPDDLYSIATQGKRWFLKNILTACGIEAGKDGVYKWDTSDVIGVNIMGKVEHIPNEYINREGDTVKNMKGKISQVKAIETK
jgi:hypothetical protein